MPQVDNKDKYTGFISNIPDSAQLKDFWLLFKKEGRIKDIVLPQNRDRNNKRYGFVKVFEKKMLERLISKYNGHFLKDKRIFVSWAKKRNTRRYGERSSRSQERKAEPTNSQGGKAESTSYKKPLKNLMDDHRSVSKGHPEVTAIDILPNKNL